MEEETGQHLTPGTCGTAGAGDLLEDTQPVGGSLPASLVHAADVLVGTRQGAGAARCCGCGGAQTRSLPHASSGAAHRTGRCVEMNSYGKVVKGGGCQFCPRKSGRRPEGEPVPSGQMEGVTEQNCRGWGGSWAACGGGEWPGGVRAESQGRQSGVEGLHLPRPAECREWVSG